MEIMTFLRTYWDRIGAIVCTLSGAALLFLGWNGVSKSAYAAGQMPYIISDGLGGLFLLGLGALLWLSADLRDEWAKLDSLDAHLAKLVAFTDLQLDSDSEGLGAAAPAPVATAPRRGARRAASATTQVIPAVRAQVSDFDVDASTSSRMAPEDLA